MWSEDERVYVCNLIGGPLDGKSYAFPDDPPYLYFPFLEEAQDFQTFEEVWEESLKTKKLIYKRELEGRFYLFQGLG
jgi:hypothetical protein